MARQEVQDVLDRSHRGGDLLRDLERVLAAAEFLFQGNGEIHHAQRVRPQVVHEGRNDMPGFGVSLTPEDIRDVSAHVAEVLAQ